MKTFIYLNKNVTLLQNIMVLSLFRLTQAALDRGYAPQVSGAIFNNSTQIKLYQVQNRPGK